MNLLELVVDRDVRALARPRQVAAPSLVFPLESTTLTLALGRPPPRV